jgi:hypothetical protein
MPEEKAFIRSKVEGVRFEDTGDEILIRFDTEERINSYELNLVWEEFMFWTKAIRSPKRSSPRPAPAQTRPDLAGDFIWQEILSCTGPRSPLSQSNRLT